MEITADLFAHHSHLRNLAAWTLTVAYFVLQNCYFLLQCLGEVVLLAGKCVKLIEGSVSHFSKVIRTCVKISKGPQVLFPLPSFHLLPFAWGLKLLRGVSHFTFRPFSEALCDLLWREPLQCFAQVEGVQNGCPMVLRGAVLLKDSAPALSALGSSDTGIPFPNTQPRSTTVPSSSVHREMTEVEM